MAMSIGNLIIGEEGQSVWRIYASPLSERNLVKSKYFFIIFFSLVVLAVTSAVGVLIYHPSLRVIIVALSETVFLIFALAAVSLSSGIKGADFNEVPRPRMIRVEWSFINLAACFLSALAILSPLFPYVLSTVIPGISFLDPYMAVFVSAGIAVVMVGVFYRLALGNAKKLIREAST
jgi:hypothetical protein